MQLDFNELGVLVNTSDVDIRQGSVGNIVRATFTGISNLTHIAKLNYSRPDGTHLDNIVMDIDSTSANSFKLVLNDVWYSAISGEASLSIYLYDGNGNIVANGQVDFDIEETDYYEQQGTITPEQYDYLLSQFASYQTAIKEYIDDGNVVELNTPPLITNITDEQYEILTHENSLIKHNNEYYYKSADENFSLVFCKIKIKTESGSNIKIEQEHIRVQKLAEHRIVFGSTIISVIYNKDQIDSIISEITDGTTIVGKAEKDYIGNIIHETYERKVDAQSKLQTAKDYTDAEVNKIKNGNYISKKAEQDKDGNQIDTTYVKHNQVVSNFNSDSATDPLSASMGKELKRLIDNINAILQSDDTDLDTIQEIVDFIQNNKDVIDTISTTKINYTDIIDALNSSAVNKVLSANQGRILKGFIDDIVNGTTTVGKADVANSATYDADGNKIDDYYFSHEDGFAVGLVDVDDYDEDTGIITLLYNSTAISDISYNSDTGVITFTY